MTVRRIMNNWSNAEADKLVRRIMTFPEKNRAPAIDSILDGLSPGLSKAVQDRVVVYRRHGHSWRNALREAIAEQLRLGVYDTMRAQEARGLSGIGDGDDVDMDFGDDPDALTSTTRPSSGSTSNAMDIVSGITGALSTLTDTAAGFYSTVRQWQQRETELEQEQERWRITQASDETARQLELARQEEREQRLEEQRRLEREEREARERADRERAREEAARERRAGLQQSFGGMGIGTWLLIGVPVVGVIAGGAYLLTREG